MVSEHSPNTSQPLSAPLTNKVMKILSSEGNKYKTFGENIILLLNRESERSSSFMTTLRSYKHAHRSYRRNVPPIANPETVVPSLYNSFNI